MEEVGWILGVEQERVRSSALVNQPIHYLRQICGSRQSQGSTKILPILALFHGPHGQVQYQTERVKEKDEIVVISVEIKSVRYSQQPSHAVNGRHDCEGLFFLYGPSHLSTVKPPRQECNWLVALFLMWQR